MTTNETSVEVISLVFTQYIIECVAVSLGLDLDTLNLRKTTKTPKYDTITPLHRRRAT